MKKYNVLLLAVMIVASIASCRTTKNACDSTSTLPAFTLAGAVDSACYSIGVSYGSGLLQSMKNFPGGEVNLEVLEKGFVQALKNDSNLLVTAEAAQAYIQSYLADIQGKEAEVEKEKGVRFLAENKTKEGVITTESGLQYKILNRGNGAIPVPENQVQVHYTGKLLDGTVFDSSMERGEPVTFGVTQVIPGWTELLQLMQTGAKYQVWIPSELAYGAQGAGQVIKPNSVLEFEVELLQIVE
ncbi:MAG: FKBP-type peptidyl-prolyl cis-trans isomerase [Tannerella sp.]|jgi:FKBP-type peptidyl-prolyl cis-trans isomerase|nr:FKBP-type peptidyl-prolyl cis-trans isomerase [Tannerella sp.]